MLKSSLLKGVLALLVVSLFTVACDDDGDNGEPTQNTVVDPAPEVTPVGFEVGSNYLLPGEDDSISIDLTNVFSDNAELTYGEPTSSDSAVATASLSNSTVTVSPEAVGRATISLTAVDTAGQNARTTFDVFVFDERINADFTADATLSAGTAYLLTEQVFVRNNSVLTIEPGTTIKALPDNGEGDAPALVIEVGSQLNADGTADAPITFTSALPEEELPQRGTWGGLILLGDAEVNKTAPLQVEGLEGETYGSNNPANNTNSSGTLRYVRVWYGGRAISQDNEINGITFAGVGSGTTVENVEVAYNLDDGFEMFGGAVNLKRCSALYVGDDGFDTDLGYQGMGQFLFVLQGREEAGRGFEMDNDGDAPDNTPRSHPMFSNITIIGPGGGSPSGDGSDYLIRLREGTGGDFRNVVLAYGNGNGLRVSGTASNAIFTQALSSYDAIVGDSLYWAPTNIIYGTTIPDDPFESEVAASNPTAVIPTDADPGFMRIPGSMREGLFGIDPRPAPGSAMLVPANVAPVPADPFFESVDYVGAFGEDLWLYPYSHLSANYKLAGGK